MAGTKQKFTKFDKNQKKITTLINEYCSKDFLYTLVTDPRYINFIGWILISVEFVLNIVIIEKVNYTEIDWIAYMQECEGFVNGTLDYTKLKGDTGPLVYPAGFVYIYSIFYYITSYGKNIYLAQYIFLFIYLFQLYLTFRIYAKTKKVPPYTLILTTLTSYRIHSIYVLRLFNDPIAVLLFYTSLNLFLASKWWLGSLFYSLAVSVKMNILLYAPCLLMTYLLNLGVIKTVLHLALCALIQLILGAPFMFVNLFGYLEGSFDLGRIFEHKWTVNYRFLDRTMFESRYLHITLLILHVFLLLLFFPLLKKYLSSFAKLKLIEEQLKPQLKPKSKRSKRKQESTKVENLTKGEEKFLDAYESQLRSRGGKKAEEPEQDFHVNFDSVSQLIVLPFFITNFIGIVCARSLHYQFYTWYFHSLLYLVYCTSYSKSIKFLILAVIEYCWNCYPSTNFSSLLLHFCHLMILFGVYKMMRK